MFFSDLADSQHIDPRVEAWGDLSRWPRDGIRHIFFGRAVHALGCKVYGAKWTGNEPTTVLRYPIHPRLDASTPPADIRYAADILYLLNAGYRERADILVNEGGAHPMPSPDEWQIAGSISRQIAEDSWSSFSRFTHVLDIMAVLFECGLVISAVRPFYFGDPEPLQPGVWLSECHNTWFATCQIDMQNSFSRIPTRTGGHWLYVDRYSFELWLELSFSSSSAQPLGSADTKAPSDRDAEEVHSNMEMPGNSGEPATDKAVPATGNAELKRTHRGAKPRYDWPAFCEAALQRARASGELIIVHQLADQMLTWCLQEWGCEPSKSIVRKRLAKLLAENGIRVRTRAKF